MISELKHKYWDLTQKIIHCAMHVHNSIGPGFKESVYQKAMAVEMDYNNMKHYEEMTYKVFHRNILVGSRRVDSVVENCIVVEYKARRELDDDDLCQGINNIEASGLEVGLLFNFGSRKLQFRRLLNSRLAQKES
jgi:GxxExxY protein